MPDRTPFLMFGRRLHNALRSAIEDGGGRTTQQWQVERPLFEHYACGMYLAGSLSFLEGKYGTRRSPKPWNKIRAGKDLDAFIQSLQEPQRSNFVNARITKNGIEALVCIRNAVTHNDNDLSKNDDQSSFSKVSTAAIPGVTLNRTVVQLTSNRNIDFMEYVRKSLVAVSLFHGDG